MINTNNSVVSLKNIQQKAYDLSTAIQGIGNLADSDNSTSDEVYVLSSLTSKLASEIGDELEAYIDYHEDSTRNTASAEVLED